MLGAIAAAVVAACALATVLALGSGGSRPPLPLNVFARPQTAADRLAFTRRRADLDLRSEPASPRVAETAPWGSQILLVLLARRGHSIGANRTRGSASFMLVWDKNISATPQAQVADGDVTESHAGGASFPPPGITAKRIATRIVVVVPNDVARVGFAYPDGGPAQTVTVHGNIAAAQFAQPCCVLEPEMTWYSAAGSVLRRELTTPGALTRFGD
jgi:hypothetical protein